MNQTTIPRLVIAVPLCLALGAFSALLWSAEQNKPVRVTGATITTVAADSPLVCAAVPTRDGNIGIVIGAR